MARFYSKYTSDFFTCKSTRDFFDQQYRYVNNLPLVLEKRK